ncbi:MAG: RecX family transcriptional regulator [Clostridia bacterium]|nr:RecX family transcriptional regulator [Clostridia bacterium]
MEITAIEAQKKDNTRCSVFVDGAFFCGLKIDVALEFRLFVGMEVSEDFLEKIQFESEKSVALERAMRHMSLALKTEKEMRRFLKDKGYLDPVIEHCIERLKYYGYIDDENYCREYAECHKTIGKKRMTAELRLRGIDSSTVEKVLACFEDDPSEMERLLERYMRGKEKDFKNRKKAQNYLFSRGFSSDDINEVIDRFFTDEDEGY